MAAQDKPDRNHLLAALAAEDFRRLEPHLEWVAVRLGETLYRPGLPLEHAYFPTTAIVSLLYVTESGAATEIASVGNEGVLGMSLFMGGHTTPGSAVVHTAGQAYRLRAKILQEEFNRCGDTQRLLLHHTRALAVQIGQTVSCNRHHSVEQQLCRWLLSTLDRVPSNDIVMTHELIASILGVRRESVTTAAGKLQRAGVLSYRRGHIAVVGRAALEAAACECYAIVKQEYRRLRSEGARARPTSGRSSQTVV